MEKDNCRHCGRTVILVHTLQGRLLCLDDEVYPNGSVNLHDGIAQPVMAGTGTHRSHFQTCPVQIRNRKPKEKA